MDILREPQVGLFWLKASEKRASMRQQHQPLVLGKRQSFLRGTSVER